MKKLVRFFGLLGVVWLLASPAVASTFLALDQKELVANSDAVIEGKVINVESYWDREGRVIVSVATVRVEDTIFGKADEVIRVQTFGGTVDGYTIEAAGFPKFARGEHVVLFVNQREALDKSIRVTGFQQGHYRIYDRQGTRMAVPTVGPGANLINRRGGRVQPQTALPLDELRSQIQARASELDRTSR